LNREFHLMIVRISGSRFRVSRTLTPEEMCTAVREHRAVLTALRRRDRQVANRRVLWHSERASRDVLSRMRRAERAREAG
jgi:DNA-binding GntR family transcriptional regulator